jgi:hypothetical protein
MQLFRRNKNLLDRLDRQEKAILKLANAIGSWASHPDSKPARDKANHLAGEAVDQIYGTDVR